MLADMGTQLLQLGAGGFADRMAAVAGDQVTGGRQPEQGIQAGESGQQRMGVWHADSGSDRSRQQGEDP